MEEAAMAVTEDEDAEGSSTCFRTTSHLKLSFTCMEVENKAKLSSMPL